jgi:drug/metabolite transporter (DMT)-like permease
MSRLPATRPHAALPYIWMLFGAASFAVMAILTASVKDRVDWQWIAIARTGLAMTFAATLALSAGKRLVFLRPAKLWMRGVAGSISLVCGFYAMTHYPVSEVLTLTNMFPLWVAVLSLPLLGYWPSSDVWPAMIVGIFGIVLIQSGEGANFAANRIAVAAALTSSFTSAVALIGLHQLRELDPRAIVAHFSAVAFATCIGALFVFPRTQPLSLDLRNAATLLAIGAFATIGQLLMTKAFTHGSPARISVVGLSQVGFTMLMEMAIWHRTFSGLTLLGIGLVMAPTAWSLVRGAPRHAVEPDELPLTKAAKRAA